MQQRALSVSLSLCGWEQFCIATPIRSKRGRIERVWANPRGVLSYELVVAEGVLLRFEVLELEEGDKVVDEGVEELVVL